jgi:hypothetical protein
MKPTYFIAVLVELSSAQVEPKEDFTHAGLLIDNLRDESRCQKQLLT